MTAEFLPIRRFQAFEVVDFLVDIVINTLVFDGPTMIPGKQTIFGPVIAI